MDTSFADDIEGLLLAAEAGVLRMRLDRSEKRNALSDDMALGLIRAIEAASLDDQIRVIELSASGEDFCSGADIVARNAPAGTKPRVGSIQRRLPQQAHRLIPTMLQTQTPVVCAARGWIAGLGLHMALAADFCVVAEDARVWEPFSTRGFTPDSGGTWLLPRLVGLARAKEMLLLGRELSGSEAAEWGLFHQAVPADEVDRASAALTERLLVAPTVSIGLTKWLVHAGLGLDLERHLANEAFALELSSRSQDFREGLRALEDHRPPEFGGL